MVQFFQIAPDRGHILNLLLLICNRHILLFICLIGLLISGTSALATTAVQDKPSLKSKISEESKSDSKPDLRRPNALLGPTVIHFLGIILDIDSVNAKTQNFDANVYVELRWEDERLAFSGDSHQNVNLNEIWNPRLVLINQQGKLNTALPNIAEVSPDGTVILRQRFTGKLSQIMNLESFPMDEHLFAVRFAAVGYNEEQLKFVPDFRNGLHGGGIAKDLSLPDWEVTGFEAKSSPFQPVGKVSMAGFVLQSSAKRHLAYYLWQIVLPFSVVIVMSWGAFWISREQLGVRIGFATSSVLTLIAHRFVLSTLLPGLSYMTRLDYFTVGGTVLVLSALVTVVLGSCYANKKDAATAKWIDIFARICFPTLYLIILIIFLHIEF